MSIDRVADASAPDGRAGDPADLPPEVHAALVALREKLAKEREAKPRDPKTFTATALNP